jgi:hypothetical protein
MASSGLGNAGFGFSMAARSSLIADAVMAV